MKWDELPGLGGVSRLTAALCAMTLATGVQGGTIMHVDDDAPPGGDGSSWQSAFRYLRNALTAASESGANPIEVRVGQGIYTPDRSEANPEGTGDRSATFQLADGLALKGGFGGLTARDPDEQDTKAYETILSGDLNGDDEIVFADGTFEYPLFLNYSDNSYHVVVGAPENGSVSLQGLTITAGNCNGDDVVFENDSGGGFYCVNSNATIDDCLFVFNRGDRASSIFLHAFDRGTCEVVLRNCVVDYNVASYGATGGSAIAEDTSSLSVTIDDCLFEDNFALSGGIGGFAFACHDFSIGNIFVQGTEFVRNKADDETGGLYIYRSIFGLADPIVSAVMLDCLFDSNLAEGRGGGLLERYLVDTTIIGCTFSNNVLFDAFSEFLFAYAFGAGAYSESNGSAYIDCDFIGNFAGVLIDSSGFGGGFMDASGGDDEGIVAASLINCSFVENESSYYGGGALGWGQDTPTTYVNCNFERNLALQGGAYANMIGGVTSMVNCSFLGNEANMDGGALFNGGNSAMLDAVNCTFIGNAAPSGGAISNWYHTVSTVIRDCSIVANQADIAPVLYNEPGATALITNSILWSNGDGDPMAGDATEVVHCIVEGGARGSAVIDADPLFISNPSPGPDREWGTDDDDYGDLRLTNRSPAIDAGNNWLVPTDLQDLDEDLDVVELVPVDFDGQPRFTSASSERGDDCTARVDMGAYEFPGESAGTVLLGDLNGDETIGFADLLILLDTWGTCEGACCIADLDVTGEIGFADLLILLDNWS